MLDSDQKPLVKLMIEDAYTDVLKRILAIAVFRVLGDIRDAFYHDKKVVPINIKQFDYDLLQSSTTKKTIIFFINKLVAKKDDLIEAVLKEYGLNLRKEEQEFYHKVMDRILLEAEEEIIACIHQGKYLQIARMTVIPKS